ncbi:MATE family efflux transporter [Lachnospiraceae bacterium 45-P1]
MTETKKNPLAEDFNAISLIRFAFPSMVMMLFMGLYTIVDTIFVARFVDTNALSSINIVCPVINLIVGLGTMLATGGSAVVAKKMGSGNTEEAGKNFTLIVVTGAVIGLLITAAGLFFLDEIIWGLGASKVLFPYCRDYLAIQLSFAVCNMMQVLYQNLFVTAGKPTLGLALAVLAGTGIGYMIPTMIGTIFFLTKRSELHFCKPSMDASVLIKSCSNGASEMVSQCSTAVTTFLFNVTMMKLLGEDGVAAITVLIYSQFLLTTLTIGFSMGTAPVVSYNCGSGNVKQLKKTVRICFCFIGGLSIIVFLFSLLGGENIAKVFTENNRNVYEITKNGFIIFSFSFLFSGYNIFSSALFTALSNGKASAAISFLRTFGFITVFLLTLPKFLEVTGVWLAVPLAEFFTFILTVSLICRHWKLCNKTHNEVWEDMQKSFD